VSALAVGSLAIITSAFSASVLGIHKPGRLAWYVPSIIIVIPILALSIVPDSMIPLQREDHLWLNPYGWSDTAVILSSLYAGVLLIFAKTQRLSKNQEIFWRRLGIIIVIATVVSLVTYPIEWKIGGYGYNHTSLPALCFSAGVFAIALRLRRSQKDEDSQGDSVFTSAVPVAALLVFIFGFVNGFLVYLLDLLPASVLTLRIAAATFVAAVILNRLVSRSTATAGVGAFFDRPEALKESIIDPKPILLFAMSTVFLVAFPVAVVAFYGNPTIPVAGLEFSGLSLVGLLVCFNAFYLLCVWVLTSFGIYHVIVWAAREFWRKLGSTAKQMAEAAPLLLILTIFVALTAETWQITYNLSTGRLIALFGLLLVLTGALVLTWSVLLLRRARRFETWAEVELALVKCAIGRDYGSVPMRLRSMLGRGRHSASSARGQALGVMPWINALLVLAVYQSFLFGAVFISLFVFFAGLTWIAVTPRVAAEWIFGDGQGGRQQDLLKLSVGGFRKLLDGDWQLLDSPWVQVPMFLTLVSILFFAAQSLATVRSRRDYFQEIDRAMRGRFAVGLSYRYLYLAKTSDVTPAADHRLPPSQAVEESRQEEPTPRQVRS
jgi:hypothetical protein